MLAIPPGFESDPRIAPLVARIAAAPEDASGYVALGDAWMQALREAPDAGYERLAAPAFERALALDPGSPDALAGLARVAGFRHEFEQSADLARRALALDPSHGDAHGLLGDAALELGQDELALEHYQAMLDLRPDLGSYARAGELLHRLGDTRRGTLLMRRAVEAASGDAEHVAWARARLARMLWSVGAIVPAEHALAPALELAPEHLEVLMARGLLATARRDYDAAIAAYEQARAVAPRHEALVALADVYLAAGRDAEASALFVLIEALGGDDPGSVEADLQMARFWADHDRNLDEAVHRAEAAHAARPTPASADTLAWCYYQAWRAAPGPREPRSALDEAARLLAHAASRRSPDAEQLYHAGLVAAARGERVRAQQQLYRALSRNPAFHPLHAEHAAKTLAGLAGGGAS